MNININNIVHDIEKEYPELMVNNIYERKDSYVILLGNKNSDIPLCISINKKTKKTKNVNLFDAFSSAKEREKALIYSRK